MDFGIISSAYSSLKAIKELGSLLLDSKIDAEAKQRVSEVMEKLGGVQDNIFFIREELIKMQDENQELKAVIKELEHRIELKNKMSYEKPFYWINEDSEKEGPFCQRCYDADGKVIHLQGGHNDVWVCRECKNSYYGPNYTAPKPQVRHSKSWLDGY